MRIDGTKWTGGCSICGDPVRESARFCRPCYYHVQKNPPLHLVARYFWPRVDQSAGPDGCWPWAGAKTRGYGTAAYQGKHIGAHRLSLILVGRSVPFGHEVRHICDNPPCVNPAHLMTGTVSDNHRDMVERNRQPEHMRGRDVCRNGHSMVGPNVLYQGGIRNGCRTCRDERRRMRRESRRAA